MAHFLHFEKSSHEFPSQFSFPEKKIESHHEFQICPFFTFTRNASIQATAKQRISVRMTCDYRIFTYRKETFWQLIFIFS